MENRFSNVVFAAFAAFAFTVAPGRAQTPDRARTEALAQRATDRLQSLQRESERLASQERTLIGDLRKLEVERQLKTEELKQIDAEAAQVQFDVQVTTRRMLDLQASELSERAELTARLVELYKLGQARYIRLLLSTPDLRRIGQASRTVAMLAKRDRDRVASHQRTLEELKAARATLDERGRQLAELRTTAERTTTAAERAARAHTDLIRDIDRQRDLNAKLAGELQSAQQRLQGTLRDLAAGSPAETAALPLRPFRGDLSWPVAGSVRRQFGRAGGKAGSSSNGMEIAAAEGTDATAIHDGVVAFSGAFAGFGNLVILDHGSGTYSLYGDLLDTAVKKGARVERGQPVGSVGATPGGAGLYFELRVDGQPVDPLQWLKKR